jgi:hypothetical protein
MVDHVRIQYISCLHKWRAAPNGRKKGEGDDLLLACLLISLFLFSSGLVYTK